jgi:hypothetical protein
METPHGEFLDCIGRVKRLLGELEAVTEALGVDKAPQKIQVRVKNKDDEDEQHEVVFPIYAIGKIGQFRKISDDMVEVSFSYNNTSLVEDFRLVRQVVNFLDGRGPDYWLGRGDFALSADDFEAEFEAFLLSVSRVFEDERGSCDSTTGSKTDDRG